MSSENNLNLESVPVPAPTLWPGLLALGLALSAASLVTSSKLGWVGGLIVFLASMGWFRQVLPQEHYIVVPGEIMLVPIVSSRRKVAHIAAVPDRSHRARLPLEIYPVSAGIKGGLAGSIAMAAVAMLYGLVSYGSIWYPVNLFGAVAYAERQLSTAQLTVLHIDLLFVAALLDLTFSALFGILYGVLLPLLPRHPILVGGLFAPLVWTVLLYPILGNVDSLLDQKINWLWFLASQVAFGVVAGLVVKWQERIPTWQYPWVVRAGIEAPGIMNATGGKNQQH
jgi:uncharacterized membrane protein YagU involved in acid resistance